RMEGEEISIRYEFTGLRKDGTTVEIETFGSKIEYEGKPAILGFSLDISERKRAQEAILQGELKFRTLVQSMNEGLLQVDNDDVIQFANDRYCEIVGYTREELLGTPAYKLLADAKDRHLIIQKNLQRTTGLKDHYEVRLRRKNGDLIWARISGSPIYDDRGNVVGSLGVHTDVTERRHMEDEVIKGRDYFRQVIDLNPSFIFAKNRKGEFTLVNQAVADAYGTSVEDLLGKTDADFNPNREEVEHFRNDDLHVMDSMTEKFIAEEQITDAKGNVRYLQTIKRPIISADGTADQILGVATDITDRRKSEIERRKLEEQLLQSQKLESIGTLAAGIAHNFNNIMAIILGYASLLRNTKLDEEKARHSVEAICKAVGRGSDLVRELTTFARRTEPSFAPLSLNSMLSELIKLLVDTFPHSISVKFAPQDHLELVIADQNQLHQAVLNLCVNARDAMPKGGSLTIATHVCSADDIKGRFHKAEQGKYVCISVTDTGIGLSEEELNRIFEPFYTTKELGKGTGLGLAVVYGIVQRHHGYMDVQSQSGKGSTFSLYFPVASSSRSADLQEISVSDDVVGGKETILLVEDEELLLHFLKYILEMKGYTTMLARDGEEAVEVFEANQDKIDLVLTDIGLPKRSGWEAFQMMKEIRPSIKVILASGYLDIDRKAAMHDSGASDFIQKPYIPNDLLHRLRKVLDES
ncbi:MAG TPA: PAS domain S-box protein, partial [Bacteroidota bacterium]|nr:PAS domain S-box protein [Bacteroidota bacterium]